MDVAEFRQKKDDYFHSQGSPLKPEDQAAFSGLKYFPIDANWQLELPLDTSVPHDVVMLQTSTGTQRRYQRAGAIHFVVQGQQGTLSVFEDANGYFLPFRDMTSENTTYGAGRYLEPEKLENGNLLVDFNLAYNPYCAYNEQFSCPLPPRENWLSIGIEAGEKRFHE